MRKRDLERLDIEKVFDITKRTLSLCKEVSSDNSYIYHYIFNGCYDISARGIAELERTESRSILVPYIIFRVADVNNGQELLMEKVSKDEKMKLDLILEIGENLFKTSRDSTKEKFKKDLI